jgi:acetyltransferase-like isoleucine patch superfamily enzyme
MEDLRAALHGLVQRHDGLPDWWAANGNVLWAPETAVVPEIRVPPRREPPRGATVRIQAYNTVLHYIALWGEGAVVDIGFNTVIENSNIVCADGSRVVIGNEVLIGPGSWIDARNGGSIEVGDHGLWSTGVRVATDDMHAILDDATRTRLNRRGSTIVIERHVWLGIDVLVLPGARIGRNSVIGAKSVVSKTIPDHVVAAGVPARIIRKGVTWSIKDME